jgi:CheY-like chemotaxis protein
VVGLGAEPAGNGRFRFTPLIACSILTRRAVWSVLAAFCSSVKLPPRGFLNGQRALELLTAAPPRLITLDLNMPHLSGVEVLSRIRATPRLHDLPVVVLTSREDVPPVVQAQATLVMHKPFDIPELLATAATFLGAPLQARAVGA